MMQPYVLLKLKADTRAYVVRGRRLCHNSRHGNLHSVPIADALRLVEAGVGKLPRHLSLAILRADVERQAEAP
jgi:hypothetical protein